MKNEILELKYFLEYQQITYYLMLLQKLIDILQLNFQKFCKKIVQYFVQDDYLFYWQDCNILLCQIVNQSEKWNQIIQALHDESDHKNKKKIRKFLIKYLIKYVIILLYNLQANEMIERNHQLIIDMLFKLMNDFIRHDQNDWITYLFSVLLVNHTIIRTSTEITSFCMMYEYEVILSIKLNVLTWQTFSWNTVKTHSDLIVMWTQQIEKHNEDIKKTCAHLWWMRLQKKKYYD